ncbi:MAG: right-handed parallel beta-helix repeat-containing protein [Paludibacter sp.]|nr:right-handed parallel beta-helix repeat-containing protein [Paludibacter sp.]
MKKLYFFFLTLLVLPLFFSCDPKEDIETPDGTTDSTATDSTSKYPVNAIVWPKDTTVTLTNHYIVPVDSSLYIEEGATIIMDDTIVRPEFIVLGNLYCHGTKADPITFTVAEKYRNEAHRFGRYWGGIICGYESKEVLLDYVTVEYGGAQTTEESASFQYQLFKTETGEGVPGFHFCNTEGKFVIENCTFRNNAEDQIYITGGQSIIANNKVIANGYDGGDAINYKSGCLADVCYNVIYDANSNGLKLSNNGAFDPQTHIFCYNNTLVNCGWRRPKVKGGSIWLEMNVYAELYNNLMFDCRWACKQDISDPQDSRSVITPNYYFASTETGVTQYQGDESKGQLVGASDIVSASAGDKNPNFVNFTIQNNVDVNAGSTKSGNVPQTFSSSWDFHLSAGSPALTGGTTNFTRHFGTSGLTIDGVEYKSPDPAVYFGAYGTN